MIPKMDMEFICCDKHPLLVTRTQVRDLGTMGPLVLLFHLQNINIISIRIWDPGLLIILIFSIIYLTMQNSNFAPHTHDISLGTLFAL